MPRATSSAMSSRRFSSSGGGGRVLQAARLEGLRGCYFCYILRVLALIRIPAAGTPVFGRHTHSAWRVLTCGIVAAGTAAATLCSHSNGGFTLAVGRAAGPQLRGCSEPWLGAARMQNKMSEKYLRGRGFAAAPVQKAEQAAARDKLGDDAQVRRAGAGTHEQHHIGVLQPLHDRHLVPELLHG
jgi:hypothetical protein